jgi:hypothetical protein
MLESFTFDLPFESFFGEKGRRRSYGARLSISLHPAPNQTG